MKLSSSLIEKSTDVRGYAIGIKVGEGIYDMVTHLIDSFNTAAFVTGTSNDYTILRFTEQGSEPLAVWNRRWRKWVWVGDKSKAVK